VTVITGNRILAVRARDLADQALPGTLARKAAGCATVALATTRTVAAARAVLAAGRLDDDVRQAAIELLGQLSHEE
jgi:hypothetical protein